MPRFNPSIQNRLLLTVLVGLFSLLATHLALNIFFVRNTYSAERDRLEGFAQAYSSMFTVNGHGQLLWIDSQSPDPRFNVPGSGLYALVSDGKNIVWTSPSLIGQDIPKFPGKDESDTELGAFSHGDPSNKNNIHRFRTPVMIGADPASQKMFTIMVFENGSETDIRVQTLSSTIWIMLGISLLLILCAQSVATRWTIRPLRHLNKDIQDVRAGKQKQLFGQYPKELKSVTDGFNNLLSHEAQQTESYRHSLANLAHSLKTPLAVLNSTLESDLPMDALKKEVRGQLKRMRDMVSYQLSLASHSGRTTFTQPILLEPLCGEIVESLEKIHKDKRAYCEFEIDADVTVRANKGDMQELLGNLLENAFKWCKHRVLLTIREDVVQQELVIVVEDDGPGVPEEHIHAIIERGVRADEHIQGHGIGLAIVSDIVRSYQGVMSVEKSDELGGARFKVTFPI